MIANGRVPLHDLFSFTKPGQTWYAWEWLSDLIFAKLNALGGLQAMALFASLLLAMTFGSLFVLVRQKANPIVAIAVMLPVCAASSLHWLARPHLFTLLFVVIFYAALEEARAGRSRFHGIPIFAALPVLTILWTNLHGGFFVGVVMIMLYGAGELLSLIFTADREQQPALWLRARRFFLCGLACLAASLVNPYFYQLHLHIARYLWDPWNYQHISEFETLSFHSPAASFFEAMLVLAAISAVANLARRRFTEPLLLLVLAHAALLAGRNIAIFVIVAAPSIAATIDQFVKKLPEMPLAAWLRVAAESFNRVADEAQTMDRMPRLHLVSLLGVLLVAALLYAPHPPKNFRSEFDPKNFPTAALATLRSDPGAHVFTFDQWGDYLIYRLYPGHKVFVDGRSDFYGNDFEDKVLSILNAGYDWEKTLNKFGVDTVLLPPSTPLAGVLKESSRWRVVYDDHTSLVFRSVARTVGVQESAANSGDGEGRDREITKTQPSDRAITQTKPKT
jgi:hypothetical protein